MSDFWGYWPAPWPSQLSLYPPVCGHCGGWHEGICPRIKSVEYHSNGTVRRIEYHDTRDSAALPASPSSPAPQTQEEQG